MDFCQPTTPVAGIPSGSRVLTPHGFVAAGEIASGDDVVLWGGEVAAVAAALDLPAGPGTGIRLTASDWLGAARNDFFLAPDTFVALRHERIAALTGSTVALCRAGHLPSLGLAEEEPVQPTLQRLVVLDRPGLLSVEGVPVEAHVPSRRATASLPASLRQAIYAAVPRLRYAGAHELLDSGLPRLDQREIDVLVAAGARREEGRHSTIRVVPPAETQDPATIARVSALVG